MAAVWIVCFLLLLAIYTKKTDFDNQASYMLWCAVMLAVMAAFVLLGVSYAAVVESYDILALFR